MPRCHKTLKEAGDVTHASFAYVIACRVTAANTHCQ